MVTDESPKIPQDPLITYIFAYITYKFTYTYVESTGTCILICLYIRHKPSKHPRMYLHVYVYLSIYVHAYKQTHILIAVAFITP